MTMDEKLKLIQEGLMLAKKYSKDRQLPKELRKEGRHQIDVYKRLLKDLESLRQ
jgi:hypothetical protein